MATLTQSATVFGKFNCELAINWLRPRGRRERRAHARAIVRDCSQITGKRRVANTVSGKRRDSEFTTRRKSASFVSINLIVIVIDIDEY